MSDEERDAGSDESSTDLEIGGDDVSGIADPALASRLETIHRSMSTLGMRIDALVTSTTSYRSALTDRLNEYADLVTKLTRAQASDLEEYRRANERTLADLRRGLSSSEESLERIGARIDSMLTDAESTDDSSRRALAEIRSIVEAQENLGRFLTESLDQFGAQVVGRLDASEQSASRQLEALQAAVSDVEATPDPALGVLDDRLAGIEDRLAVVASDDSAAALGGRFDTLHAALDELGRQIGDDGADATVATQLERIERELASAGKVSNESFGEIAGVRAKIDAILETSANQSGAVSEALEQLKDTLLDVASGEVVGALWDEVRQVRATVEALVDRDEQTVDPVALETLRTDVTSLTDSVRALLDRAEVADDDTPAGSDDGYLVALAADVAALRDELSKGLVIETSDSFGASVDQLRTDLAGIGERLSVVSELRESVAELRTATETAAAAKAAEPPAPPPAPAPAPTPPPEMPEELEAELRALRSGVEDIIGRLDEGFVLDADPAAAPEVAPELADQVATLRDQVSVEFERVRHLVQDGAEAVDLTPLTARLDQLHDDLAEREAAPTEEAPTADLSPVLDVIGELRDRMDDAPGPAPVDLEPVLEALGDVQAGIAHLLDRPTPTEAPAPTETPAPTTSETYATIDPDTIDLLREEIRTAGSTGDELVATLASELKALRRRIRLRAEGEIFSDEQLELIAESVAKRLGDER